MKNELCIPQMLLIGASGRNSGKTTIAVKFINDWKDEFTVIALKITTIEKKDGKCPRGGNGCGVCTNINGDFQLIEEKNMNCSKDTSVLLASGAEKVFWLKVLKEHIYEGINSFLSVIPKNAIIICESNSLRKIVKPGVFLMIKNTKDYSIKKSAAEVMNKADLVLEGDFLQSINEVVKKVSVDKINGFLRIKIRAVS